MELQVRDPSPLAFANQSNTMRAVPLSGEQWTFTRDAVPLAIRSLGPEDGRDCRLLPYSLLFFAKCWTLGKQPIELYYFLMQLVVQRSRIRWYEAALTPLLETSMQVFSRDEARYVKISRVSNPTLKMVPHRKGEAKRWCTNRMHLRNNDSDENLENF